MIYYKGKPVRVLVTGAPHVDFCELSVIQHAKDDGEPYGVSERPDGFKQFISVNPSSLSDKWLAALKGRLQACRYGREAMLAKRITKSLLAGGLAAMRLSSTLFVIIAAWISRYFMKKEKPKYPRDLREPWRRCKECNIIHTLDLQTPFPEFWICNICDCKNYTKPKPEL